MHNAIKIHELSKSFIVQDRRKGVFGAIKNFFFAQKRQVEAIAHLSFEIEQGERVAFIGPNGAGKSTAIKMLTGILYPTAGEIEVLGLVPWKNRHALGYHIGTVFGQRTQLWYHLPVLDTFDLLSKIYEISEDEYKKKLVKLVDLFEIPHLLKRTVRQLSLGERMRCEIVASLIHTPKILFLDEPTIGLDINAKLTIRALLNTLSKEENTTLLLTSHDTADIEQVCDRVLVLDKGVLIADSPLKDLRGRYMRKKILTFITEEPSLSLTLPGVQVLENSPYHFSCEVDCNTTPIDFIIREVLKITSLKDITIEDPSMEEIIRLLYGNASHE